MFQTESKVEQGRVRGLTSDRNGNEVQKGGCSSGCVPRRSKEFTGNKGENERMVGGAPAAVRGGEIWGGGRTWSTHDAPQSARVHSEKGSEGTAARPSGWLQLKRDLKPVTTGDVNNMQKRGFATLQKGGERGARAVKWVVDSWGLLE